MSTETKNNVAIITARGGSKRIPGKNIRDFHGKPILAYSIETALRSELFELVMVSTDDPQIADIAISFGAQVPFMRSAATSDDFAGTADVLKEVILQLKETGLDFPFACGIYPTAPFITKEALIQGYTMLCNENYDSVFPVCRFSYPVQRALRFTPEGKTAMLWPENLNKRSQDLEPVFHDAGQFYWIQTASFLEAGTIITPNCGSILLDEMQVQDMDNEEDWKMAELKYALRKHQ